MVVEPLPTTARLGTEAVDLDLGGDVLRQNAMRGLCADWARRPPFRVVNHGMSHLVVGRYRDVVEVYQNPDRFTVELPGGEGYERFDFFNGLNTFAQIDGDDHDRVRRAFTPAFGALGVARMSAAIAPIVAAMLDRIEARGPRFDAINDFATDLVVRILLEGVLGLDPLQRAAFVRMHAAFSLVADLAPGSPRPPTYLAAQDGVLAVIAQLIADRRTRPQADELISSIVQSMDETGSPTMIEVIGNIFAILGAGQGTTASATAAMLRNLARRRDQWRAIVADPGLVRQAVEESLRFQGPGYFSFGRFATADGELAGTPYEAGMPVLVSQQAANYDPTVFADPLAFDIHRKRGAFLTFGNGPHFCLGNRLARRIMEEVLTQVSTRFPDLALQKPDFEPVYGGMWGELRPLSVPMTLDGT